MIWNSTQKIQNKPKQHKKLYKIPHNISQIWDIPEYVSSDIPRGCLSGHYPVMFLWTLPGDVSSGIPPERYYVVFLYSYIFSIRSFPIVYSRLRVLVSPVFSKCTHSFFESA